MLIALILMKPFYKFVYLDWFWFDNVKISMSLSITSPFSCSIKYVYKLPRTTYSSYRILMPRIVTAVSNSNLLCFQYEINSSLVFFCFFFLLSITLLLFFFFCFWRFNWPEFYISTGFFFFFFFNAPDHSQFSIQKWDFSCSHHSLKCYQPFFFFFLCFFFFLLINTITLKTIDVVCK